MKIKNGLVNLVCQKLNYCVIILTVRLNICLKPRKTPIRTPKQHKGGKR